MLYSTVLKFPNTHGSTLLIEIARVEPRLAKASGYSAKIVEKSGVQLGRMFDKKMETVKCGRTDCQPCGMSDKKSRCKKNNVVYRATCQDCVNGGAKNPGTYIGETSQTLYERCTEHMGLLESLDVKSFAVKHWAQKHADNQAAPVFKFEVAKQHRDALSRALHEALLIEKEGNLNSKADRAC